MLSSGIFAWLSYQEMKLQMNLSEDLRKWLLQ